MRPSASLRRLSRRHRAITDGLSALRLVITSFMLGELAATVLLHQFYSAAEGPLPPHSLAHMVIATAAATAIIWGRLWPVALLTGAVVLDLFLTGTYGGGAYVYMAWVGMLAAVGRGRALALGVIGLAGYAGAVSVLTVSRGWGTATQSLITDLTLAGVGTALGLTVRWLRRLDDASVQALQDATRESEAVRAAERDQLAAELNTVVATGLAGLDRATGFSAADDASALNSRLDEVGRISRRALDGLRDLLSVLRNPELTAPVSAGAPVSALGARHGWVDGLNRRDVRLAASIVAGALLLRIVATHGGAALSGATDAWAPILGGLALVAAVQRPYVAMPLAVAALALTLEGPQRTTAALLFGLIGVVGAALPTPIGVVGAPLLLFGYLGGLTVVAPEVGAGWREVLGLLTGLGVGLTVRYFRAARRTAVEEGRELAAQHQHTVLGDRTEVARELHDVVGHQLSLTVMEVMAGQVSDDVGELRDTLTRIARLTHQARHEVTSLVQGLHRGERDPAEQPAAPLPPTQALEQVVAELRSSGFRVTSRSHGEVDDVGVVVSRTISRVLQEASTNILRYAPRAADCSLELSVDKPSVQVAVTNACDNRRRLSEFSTGWGLKGLEERISLCRGNFQVGPRHGHWVVKAELPLSDDVSVAAPVPQESILLRWMRLPRLRPAGP